MDRCLQKLRLFVERTSERLNRVFQRIEKRAYVATESAWKCLIEREMSERCLFGILIRNRLFFGVVDHLCGMVLLVSNGNVNFLCSDGSSKTVKKMHTCERKTCRVQLKAHKTSGLLKRKAGSGSRKVPPKRSATISFGWVCRAINYSRKTTGFCSERSIEHLLVFELEENGQNSFTFGRGPIMLSITFL